MRCKSETRTFIQSFITYISTHFSAKVKMIRTDNGTVFNMPSYYSSLAILFTSSTDYQTPVLNQKSPYEMLYQSPPTFMELMVFDCLSYATTLTNHRHKLDPRARKCLFLGFKPGTKGYLPYDFHTRDTFVSRHAIFYESIFPYDHMPLLIWLLLNPHHISIGFHIFI